MPRRADAALLARMATLRSDMSALENDLMRYGDKELSAVVKRAKRELDHPAYTAAINTVGVNHGDFRK